MSEKNIRNFCIIAHIDHGKSTLADRILEKTGAISKREMKEQLLDNMELEREKGITIKSQAVSLEYQSIAGEKYHINLIDTPGHVDFAYEVSRSLSACEGALLVVDATQGVEAQTLANVYLAMENNLEILPVINKVDLPNADVERVKKDIEDTIGLDTSNAVLTSAKTGLGIDNLMEAIVEYIPPPKGDEDGKLQALIFDSYFNDYRGVVVYVRVMEGQMAKGDEVLVMSTKKKYEILDLGILTPAMVQQKALKAGSVGYLILGIKSIREARTGDTITLAKDPAQSPLQGYKEAKPMVFAGIFPINNDNFTLLRESIEKIQLNDPSLVFEPESSDALGFGFRVGFLGLLHMEIILERLRREYLIDLISSAPSVVYKVRLSSGEEIEIDNPSALPSAQKIDHIKEPMVSGNIMSPKDFVGDVMQLCTKKRGIFKDMKYLDEKRVVLSYELPLSEIVIDFYDKLKSLTKGYASFEYELSKYVESKLVRLDILLNGEKIDALSYIAHVDSVYYRGKEIVEKLKELIPKHMFDIPIQAAIGNKIVARETIKAMRKNVLSKCYGGDISRKRKLLEKQKEGKKKMKSVGSVSIPQEAFLSVLKID